MQQKYPAPLWPTATLPLGPPFPPHTGQKAEPLPQEAETVALSQERLQKILPTIGRHCMQLFTPL